MLHPKKGSFMRSILILLRGFVAWFALPARAINEVNAVLGKYTSGEVTFIAWMHDEPQLAFHSDVSRGITVPLFASTTNGTRASLESLTGRCLSADISSRQVVAPCRGRP
jgi:hypothetical protein